MQDALLWAGKRLLHAACAGHATSRNYGSTKEWRAYSCSLNCPLENTYDTSCIDQYLARALGARHWTAG